MSKKEAAKLPAEMLVGDVPMSSERLVLPY